MAGAATAANGGRPVGTDDAALRGKRRMAEGPQRFQVPPMGASRRMSGRGIMRMSTRAGEAWRVLREDGPRRLAQRVSRVAYQRLRASELDFPLDLDHVADSRD